MYEEDAIKSANMLFNLYIGWGLQEFEVGGVIAWVFPLTDDNEMAALELIDVYLNLHKIAGNGKIYPFPAYFYFWL
jgi:hypothetical protein